jgi:hypothetical protein
MAERLAWLPTSVMGNHPVAAVDDNTNRLNIWTTVVH